jgi:hypothetical protein
VRSAFRGFRFTIGQGMVVIALSAVAFAFMPAPAAVVLTLATPCLIALGHRRIRQPTLLSESIVAIFVFFGLFGGVALGRWCGVVANDDRWIDDDDLCALAGIFTGVVLGRLVGTAILGPSILANEAPDAKHADTRFELKVVEEMLRRAHEDGDEITISKLTDYRAKLEHDLLL